MTLDRLICRYGLVILIIFGLIEIVLFTSLPNFAGVVFTIILWIIYSQFCRNNFARRHFMVYLTLTGYVLTQCLALPITVLYNIPITYGFESPYLTFLLETITFIIILLGIRFATRVKINPVRAIIKHFGAYKIPRTEVLWVMGIVGVICSISNRIASGLPTEFQHFIQGLIVLTYAPYLTIIYTEKLPPPKSLIIRLLLYTIFLIGLSFLSNSRQALIKPVLSVILVGFAFFIIESPTYYKQFFKSKFFYISFISMIGFAIFANAMSEAILSNRKYRDDVTAEELARMQYESIDLNKTRELKELTTYSEGWVEDYVPNAFFNRYCNLRIQDECITLILNNNESMWLYGNNDMQNDLADRIIRLVPSPFLRLFNVETNKEESIGSPGDHLYAIFSHTHLKRSFIITSLTPTLIACFGIFYPIVLFFCIFVLCILADSLNLRRSTGRYALSFMGFLLTYYFFFFSMSWEIIQIILFCLRSFLQFSVVILGGFAISKIVFRCIKHHS